MPTKTNYLISLSSKIITGSQVFSIYLSDAFLSEIKTIKNNLTVFLIILKKIRLLIISIKNYDAFLTVSCPRSSSTSSASLAIASNVFESSCYFFFLSFLSRTFMNHRTASEEGGHFFNPSLPLPPTSQTLRH